jgi:hypothetical protein
MMCDPDSIAGEYGYRCVGAGDDYPAIGQALTVLAAEMNKRRLQRKQGTRRFAPIWVFVDEVHDVVREVDGAWGVLDDGLRRGRKLDIHLGLGTQDAQVRNLGLEGKGQLLNNLTRVLITRTGDTRWAVVGDEEFVLPALPSPDDMVKPGSSPPQNTETDPLLATLLGSVSGSLKPKTTQTTETTKPVFGNDLNQAIRERLAAGESKNKVCTWLAETHGIRNKVTALKLIQQAKQ